MGNVYLPFSPGGYPLAIKVVKGAFADDPEFRRRFRREIAATLRVQGYYTAPVRDAAPDDEIPRYATEYIAGPSLQVAVAEHGPLPAFSVYRLLAGAAEGIAAVHAAGLIHRDLKPNNVPPADDGPRVTDFGLAQADSYSRLTSTGVAVGTAAYMAPEQVRGKVKEATEANTAPKASGTTRRPMPGSGHPEVTEQCQRRPGMDRNRLVRRALS